VARNSGSSITVYAGFFAAGARALTARRMRKILDAGFVNLYTSTAELHIAAVAPGSSYSIYNLWSTP
jgi:hypothetical protein